MAYFREYFEEAGPENEPRPCAISARPKEAASEILQNLLHDDNGARKNDTARTLKIAAIAMLLSPIGWLGLLFGGIFLVVAAAMIFRDHCQRCGCRRCAFLQAAVVSFSLPSA